MPFPWLASHLVVGGCLRYRFFGLCREIYREAATQQSPGLPRFAANLGCRESVAATLTGLRRGHFATQRSRCPATLGWRAKPLRGLALLTHSEQLGLVV